MAELRELIERHGTGDVTATAIPGLTLMRAARPSACQIPGMYLPMICVIAQGAKELTVGTTSLVYDPETYVASSIVLPASGRVISASRARPYLAAILEFDLASFSSILAEAVDRPLRFR